MGVNFGDVRIHSDSRSHAAASTLRARAFTHKNQIWLGKGETQDDLNLMAHEAVHVLQQDGLVRRKSISTKRVKPPAGGECRNSDYPH